MSILSALLILEFALLGASTLVSPQKNVVVSTNSAGKAVLQATAATCAGEFQSVSTPLTEMGTKSYIRMDGQTFTQLPGKVADFTGGLYFGGSNVRPVVHEKAGIVQASQVQKLDEGGSPSASGKIAIISIGMSNTSAEFTKFMDLVEASSDINADLVLVDGAQKDKASGYWVNSSSATWDEVDSRLEKEGLTPAQVQVAWVKQSQENAGYFPSNATSLQEDLNSIVTNLKIRYPNIKLAYLSNETRSYAYWTGVRPEPASFETGFAIKWLLQSQIEGSPDLNYDPSVGSVNAPWLSWGPYLWVNNSPRSDGFAWTATDLSADCTSPSSSGSEKVAHELMKFFKTDTTTSSWFLRDEEAAAAAPSETPYLNEGPSTEKVPSVSELPLGAGYPSAVAFADPKKGEAPLEVVFDASKSVDLGGELVSYLWSFGDGTSSSAVSATHTYNEAGSYNASLVVTDNDGNTATDSLTVAVMADTTVNTATESLEETYQDTTASKLKLSLRNFLRKLIGLSPIIPTPVEDIPDDTLRYCEEDTDCISVKQDCCGCEMGGNSFSINKKYAQLWNSKQAKSCKDINCLAVYQCDGAEPVCADNLCVLGGGRSLLPNQIDVSTFEPLINVKPNVELE